MKYLLITLFLIFFTSVFGQVATLYTFSETVGTYSQITNGSQLVTTTGGATAYDTDGNNINLPAGSQFIFNGVTVTSVNMTADGAIWCNPISATTGNGVTGPIQSGASALGVIAAMGMDLRSTSLTSQVYERRWEDIGTEVVFQWQNCARYLQDGVERFSFQVRVEKSTGTVRVVYGNMTTIANSTTYVPQVGLRGTTNADFNTRRLTASVPDATPNWGAPNGTTAGTTNGHAVRFTGNSSCFPASGLTFIWTYSGPMGNNDACSAATLISLPYTSGVVSTIGATTDVPSSVSGCATQGNNLWYRVVGNGSDLTASTCNNSTNFDTEIRVYTGSCSSLNTMVEVNCNDDEATCAFSTVQSIVSWCSTSGIDYYISVGYFSSSGGTGNFILSVTSGAVCGALPIKLLNFNVKKVDNFNFLNWTTATEINNAYFTIQRSNSGLDWENLDNIDGNGNSSTYIDYEYKDFKFQYNVINYYRLKQVDFDGKYEYSPIVYIQNNSVIRLIRTISIEGKEVDKNYRGFVIDWYDDGSCKKRIQIPD